MRLAIISDVHGNLEALKEVLADIDQSQVDSVVCLGDNIGYGPEPEGVVRLVRERYIPCIMGNHELAVVEPKYLDWMNPIARRSLILTRDLISQDTLDYIHGLRFSMSCAGNLCVHGCPPDSVITYLIELSKLEFTQLFPTMRERICFVGHTHDLQMVSFDGKKVTQAPLYSGEFVLQPEKKYIINVGSVGQPRDGDSSAKYVIWDDTSGQIEVKYIPYNVAATARKILELGLPEFNADRLF